MAFLERPTGVTSLSIGVLRLLAFARKVQKYGLFVAFFPGQGKTEARKAVATCEVRPVKGAAGLFNNFEGQLESSREQKKEGSLVVRRATN